MTGEYISLKSTLGLYVNPCATSLSLCLTTLSFSFRFQTKTHLNPTRNTCGGAGITWENTCLFVSEDISTWIASFHWFQSGCVLHSAMVLGSRSFSRISAIIVEKYESTIVVFLLNDSLVSAYLMEISWTLSDASSFPKMVTSGYFDVPTSVIECTIDVGCEGWTSTRCSSTCGWVAFTRLEDLVFCFHCLLEAASVEIDVLLPLLLGSWVVLFGTSTLFDTFLTGL